MSRITFSVSKIPGPLSNTLVGMYLLEASAVIAILTSYKSVDSSLSTIISSRLVYGFFFATILLLVALALLVRDYRNYGNTRSFVFTIILNLASVMLLVAVVEVGLRIAIFADPAIRSAFPRGFLPNDWNDVAAKNMEILAVADQTEAYAGSFLVHDERLGWTLGASRTSNNGLYFSSEEGIRSGAPEYSYGDTTAARRIALIGDSYTFGTSVAFEDTWGQQLQEKLGQDFQVLNFGVGGYGVDQAYLKYLEEVRQWEPEIVILGLISHDLYRSQVVYPFISFPAWRFPFAKPRFVLENENLVLSNVPLPSPKAIFAATSIEDLPKIELEPAYFAFEWERNWYHEIFLVRFLISVSPRWPVVEPGSVRSLIRMNAAIIRAFVDSATIDGSDPIVVFFPSYRAGEVGSLPGSPGHTRSNRVHETLAAASVEYLSLKMCLRDLPAIEGLAPDETHYSPAANAEVADCLYSYLQQLNLIPKRER